MATHLSKTRTLMESFVRQLINDSRAEHKRRCSKINYQAYKKHIGRQQFFSKPYKRKTIFTNKITQLKEEVALWENNLGFAESKNSDLLKVEFEENQQPKKLFNNTNQKYNY